DRTITRPTHRSSVRRYLYTQLACADKSISMCPATEMFSGVVQLEPPVAPETPPQRRKANLECPLHPASSLCVSVSLASFGIKFFASNVYGIANRFVATPLYASAS